MMSHSKLIVGAVVLAVVVAGIVFGLLRLTSEMDCWEASGLSPEKLMAESDYVALARLKSRKCITDFDVLKPGDSIHFWLTEEVFETSSPAKGACDSVAIWQAVYGDCQSRSNPNDSVALEYGRIVGDRGALPKGDSTFLLLNSSPEVAKALSLSPIVRKALEERGRTLPVLAYTDGGSVSTMFWINEMCYYDRDGKAHSVSAKKYWQLIQRVVHARE
jgi:hypothetical protein